MVVYLDRCTHLSLSSSRACACMCGAEMVWSKPRYCGLRERGKETCVCMCVYVV